MKLGGQSRTLGQRRTRIVAWSDHEMWGLRLSNSLSVFHSVRSILIVFK